MNDIIKQTIDSYNKTVSEYHEKGLDAHPDTGSDFLSHLKSGALILDLGCGPGRNAKIFTDKGYKCIGVDLSPKMIEFAKEYAPKADFEIMDVCELDFEDNKFDGIWANAIFLHVTRDKIQQALNECFRVLKPGGTMYVIALKLGDGEEFVNDDRYGEDVRKLWVYYSVQEFEKYLKQAGFRIMKSYTRKSKRAYTTKIKINIFCQKPI